MSAVLRFVTHRIIRHPGHKPTVAARCLWEACEWAADPGPDLAEVDRQCMAHTGRHAQHTKFLRSFEDVALVSPVSP
ncbi:hypothetical protein ABT084_15840 [Streptomyces sp. NPDC002138]|uniref:DUF7848 domain-containing protein n=1 Tax=Streptomyces sp. NPDC002138 TaxID=3154410 RepID=UPI003331F1E0